MKITKLLFGIVVMLLSLATWAQTDNSQQNSTANSNPITVRGCLTGSAGAYVLLADQQGKPYMLQGQGASLDKMIHQEVEITGQLVNETGNEQRQTASGAENSGTQPPGATLHVSSVREISDTCSAKGPR